MIKKTLRPEQDRRILVVDDDEGILDAFSAMLETLGYSVIPLSDAENIVEISRKKLPDLILLDILLSGSDGREICKLLKKNKDTKNIPVVLVSAHPGADKSGKAAGADGFLKKPFEMKELLNIVRKYAK